MLLQHRHLQVSYTQLLTESNKVFVWVNVILSKITRWGVVLRPGCKNEQNQPAYLRYDGVAIPYLQVIEQSDKDCLYFFFSFTERKDKKWQKCVLCVLCVLFFSNLIYIKNFLINKYYVNHLFNNLFINYFFLYMT